MKTKILSLIVAMIAVIALLASCGGGGGGNTDGTGGNNDGNGGGADDGSGTGNNEYGYGNWASSELLIEYSENTQQNELSSGTKRYYAGMETTAREPIDNAVRSRNDQAVKAANVTLKYSWLPDENAYAWGANVGRIVTQTAATTATAPDIYVNFAYDITCAQLRGCFANLLSEDPTVYEYGNHFRFIEDDYNPASDNYFDSSAGEGYFYHYMESLSLTPETKMYCLASNFCVDLVRAFLVVPVNVYMMNGIKAESAPAGDRVGNGDGHNIADFYDLVWNNEWNYDALAGYATAVFKGNNDGGPKADIYDTLGFCLGTASGLTGAGMLYTSSVKIIHFDETTGKYYYPETNKDLEDFVNNLRALMKNNESNGIATNNEGTVNGVSYGTDLKAIRARFSENNILFGGVIAVGSLEDSVYQGMKPNGGFGVVPVPLYKDYVEGTNEYQTLVHNLARIVAIAANSTEKSQCTAYLDYQSRHSEAILEDYYEYKLTAATQGGEAASDNARMMVYIRNHVRNCFDKTFEDAISAYNKVTDLNADATRWHYMIQKENFQMSNISTRYEELYEDKQADLDAIYAQWTELK